MNSPARPSRMRGLLKGALLAIALIVLLVVLFDWNWLRPGIERYLTACSHRVVRFDDLRVSFSPTLAPTVRLRGVHIQNAPWADARPMATVGEVSFVFASLKTVFDNPSVVSRLVLIDGDVDLEWRSDGLRNWRLRKPDYTGPGRYRILRLDARRSQVRYVNGSIGLMLDSSSVPAPPGSGVADSGEPLTKRIRFNGTYAGAPFSVDLLTGDVLSLQETQELFPLRGHADSAATHLDIDGRIGDFFKLGEVDAQLRVAGPSLALLHPFLRSQPPASRPFQASGHVKVTQNEYAFENFRGTLGQSGLAGSAIFSRNTPRRSVRAVVRSELVYLADLPSFSAKTTSPTAAQRPDPDHLFSHRSLDIEHLRNEDIHLALEVKKLVAPEMPMLQSLHTTADLKNGVLTLDPFKLGVAGGHAVGRINLDGRQQPAAVTATLELRNLRAGELAARLPSAALSGGAITAHVSLTGRGNSLAAILGSASGTLGASMTGGSISDLLDAKLELNGGKLVWLKLSGDHNIPVNCAVLAFDIRNGVGSSRTLLLDTSQTRISGAGTVNLRDEQFNLLLTPHAKQGRIFALGNAIRAEGSFKHPNYSIDKGAPPASAAPEPGDHGQC